MYSLMPILGPDPAAMPSAEAFSLGNDGQAAGVASVNVDEIPLGVGAQWLDGLLATTLPPPNNSTLWGINDGLVAVGGTTPDNYATISAIVVDTGNVTDLSPLVGTASWAADVNDDGLVCGGDRSGNGFLYSVPAKRLFATVPGVNLSVINNPGEALGLDVGGKVAVYSVTNGTTKPLNAMAAAYSINDEGIVCGSSGTAPTYNEVPGICDSRQATPVFQVIPLPDGAIQGTAQAINNSGVVVGTCLFGGQPETQSAFVYQNGTTTLLDTLISEPGWQLSYTFDINASGQIIGMGKLNGVPTAFMLTPASGWQWWQWWQRLPLPILVGTLLGGVASDAGGWTIIGGRRIPIDPWGPWLQLQPEKRDALMALAMDEIASFIADEATRVQVRTTLVEAANSRLKHMDVRPVRTGPPRAARGPGKIPLKNGLPVSWLRKFGR
ncbi:hypothetical protein [Paraburkholderia nodosa]|uniref:hypothetical protein n=1 Tax=Paraburkholderia nodosa TaxID=392320 RepID=UPI000841F127|nr:hypothetical protein [Paraburkholderia nodosa]